MSDADEKLKMVFALDEPPFRDPAFVLQTAHLIQRRRLVMEWVAGIPWVIAASAILWAATPWLEAASRPLASLMTALAPAASVAFIAIFFIWPRSHEV